MNQQEAVSLYEMGFYHAILDCDAICTAYRHVV